MTEEEELEDEDEFDSIDARINALKKTDRKGLRLSPEKRADVVAYLIGGVSATKIAKETGVAIATIYRIKRQYEEDQYQWMYADCNHIIQTSFLCTKLLFLWDLRGLA